MPNPCNCSNAHLIMLSYIAISSLIVFRALIALILTKFDCILLHLLEPLKLVQGEMSRKHVSLKKISSRLMDGSRIDSNTQNSNIDPSSFQQ